ncbi:unnamed protein product [Coregonus sp. 'balchen']|nr:unnamed protein product [Coregonus sp. 'balchen']
MRGRLISVAACLFTLLCPCHVFQVTQPVTQTVNPDGLAGDAPVPVCPSPAPESPEAELIVQLKWIVIGLSTFLCLYSFTITFFYIRLRVMRSEELYDSLTYVPMQPNQPQPTVRMINIYASNLHGYEEGASWSESLTIQPPQLPTQLLTKIKRPSTDQLDQSIRF